MLDNPYKFRFATKESIAVSENETSTRHIYVFRDTHNNTYIVNADLLKYNVYVVKFFLKSHRLSENKYRLLTDKNSPFRVLTTCFAIMHDICKKNPFASFYFQGSNTMEETDLNNTKRYGVYKKLCARAFHPSNFLHYKFDNESQYLLINKENTIPNYPQIISEYVSNLISLYGG